MRKVTLLLIMFFFAFSAVPAFACKPVRILPGGENKDPPAMILSSDRQVMMKIIPPHYTWNRQRELVVDRNAYGEAFRLSRDGKLTLLWRMPLEAGSPGGVFGSYYLANDGQFLVRIRNASGLEDKDAMVVYFRGKPSARYSPRTFMPKLKNLQIVPCVGGQWLKYSNNGQNTVVLHESMISFQTIDNKKWSFDIRKPLKN
ncbi:MAG: hypothetical protein R3E95_08270 [Thiolinea sp.]